MKIKYVTLIQDNRLVTSGFFGRRYQFSTTDDLIRLVGKLIDDGFCFVDEPAGWPPAAILKDLQEKGLLRKNFTAITWSGPGKFQTYEVRSADQEDEPV